MYKDISKDRMSTTEKDYTDLAIRETDHVYIDVSQDRMSSQERDYTDLGNRGTEHMYGNISKDEKNAPENNYTDLTARGTEHMYGDISKDGIIVPENDYTNLGNRKAEHIYGSLNKHVVNDEAKPGSGAFLTAKIRLIAFVSIFVMCSVTSVVVIVLLTQNSGEESTISTQSTSDYITGTTNDMETTTNLNKKTLSATQFLAPNTTNEVSVTTGQLPAKTTELTTPPTPTAIIEGSISSWVDWTSRYIPVQLCSHFASSPPWELAALCRLAWYPYKNEDGYTKDGYKVCKAKFKYLSIT
ncbi:uncharacterized protein LOC128217914 isoform X2 [Mya arenaria]|uniref:uncharacterized protein LOC128217914 isoform X2 n=1 Tax=Mya arenaria TaxID=6604 RepID=UPI0022E5D0AC|nr:uncharacterized protein LOC128217914 isoform X2 [Mya arenaria]